jgi:hypothetical protein
VRGRPATDYDSPWKEALDRYFERCMAFFFPQAHADIDWTRGYEMLDKEGRRLPETDACLQQPDLRPL